MKVNLEGGTAEGRPWTNGERGLPFMPDAAGDAAGAAAGDAAGEVPGNHRLGIDSMEGKGRDGGKELTVEERIAEAAVEASKLTRAEMIAEVID